MYSNNRTKNKNEKVELNMTELEKVIELIEDIQMEEYYYYETLTEDEVETLAKIYLTGVGKGVVRLELGSHDFGFGHNQEEYFEDFTKFPTVITLYKELNNVYRRKQVIDL